MKSRSVRNVGIACGLALGSLAPAARAADVSPPVILQWFESSWQTMQRRTPDLFSAGYGAIWTPPPGRALYDDQGGGIGYNLYDRFDLGKAGDPTLYGTENQYRSLINQVHKTSGDVYVDYVHHHVGSWDVPGYNGWDSYAPASWQHVQERSDYPGFELSDPYVGANSFDPNYRNFAGHRDSYPDAPPVNDGNTPQYQYQYRLAHLITIDLTSNRAFVRNPVPGDPNNIRQAPSGWGIATSVLLTSGQPGASSIIRQANTPTSDNKRFYPDQSLPGITVTDPADGNQSFTIHPFNTSDPAAGDPIAETNRGYMMRYAQWLVNDVGVDGLRIDAARHVPYGQSSDPYNPQDLNIPALIDRAVYRQNRRTNLNGSTRQVFSFQEVFSGDKNLLNTFTRKDINPATPNVVGGNRDVLDFPMWFAMRSNMTGDGVRNNWFNMRSASQNSFYYNPNSSTYVNDSNNGNNAIGFVINHDDGKGNSGSQNTDYIVLDNVAHAWILTRPGNAYVYFNSHEFDRTGNTEFFLKDGRGDALGGQYGTIVTNLIDIRNSYGRGNFIERYIDNAFAAPEDQKSAIYVYERDKSMLVALNVGYNEGYTERNNVQTNFGASKHLVELTGHYDNDLNQSGSPYDGIPRTLVTNGSGQISALRIPWNNAGNGNKGYVIYGLPRPQGNLALSNVSQTIAAQNTGNNATDRVTPIQVITGNSFNVTLSTNAVILSDGYHDTEADGDNAVLRFDGGLDVNGNSAVDNTTPGTTVYGFENFLTTSSPGYSAPSSNGTYAQTVNAANLSEGYHYITARAFRHRSDGGPEIFTDFKKVIYVDRLPPSSGIAGITQSGSGSGRTLTARVQSLDQTADNVHVLMDTGAALTDAQILALVNSGSAATQTDVDLFDKSVGVTNGTHVMTIVTREITGNYSIIRATGVGVSGGNGLGFGDTNASGSVDTTDISQFQSVLESSDAQFNAGAEANTDGRVTLADAFLLGPRLAQVGASAPTVSAYNSMLNSAYVTSGTYTVDANHTVHNVTAGTTHVLPGNTLTARSLSRGNLVVDNGARVSIQSRANSGSTVYLTSLSLGATGVLDLADQDLVVSQGSYTALRALVSAGFGTNSAITSTTSNGTQILALFDNALVGRTSFNGVTIAANAIVGKYTYFGDVNLDGQVTGDDYTVIDSNLNTTPAVGIEWTRGDANRDGSVTGDDYTTIDSKLGLGVGNPLSPANLSSSAVPEPGSMLIVMGLCLLAARRKR